MKTIQLLAAVAAIGSALHAQAEVPTIITYQGRVQVSDSNFTGTGQFKFALVDAGSNTTRQAAAVATVTSGFITGIAVIDGGAGYTSPPTVTISDPTGSGAAAVASVSGGTVTSIAVQNAGNGYSASPTVTIATPTPNPVYVTHWSNDGSSGAGSEPAAAISLPVTKGLFTARLGDAALANMTSIPPDVLTNQDVHLRIWFNDGANGFAALSPDQPLTAAPYALHALNASAVNGPVPTSLLTGTIAPVNLADGGIDASKLAANSVTSAKIADGAIQLTDLSGSVSNAFWRLGGNSGTVPGTNFIGTMDNRPLEVRVNDRTALRIFPNFASPNIVGGYVGNEAVGNVAGAVIAGGGQSGDTFGTNRVLASHSTISGGKGHTIAGGMGTIGGGFRNTIETNAPTATIAGGRSHTIQSNSPDATIGGGQNNSIGTNAMAATIAGGLANKILANAERATIGGGYFNSAGSPYAVVGGGTENQATNNYALVAGGYQNRANGEAAVVGGGQANAASAWYATISGGFFNSALRDEAVVAGGGQNAATNYSSTVSGGRVNLAGGISSTVAGGELNTAIGDRSVVGGGSDNETIGPLSVVPGGANNTAAALLSFAAGYNAKANHEGTFVWADTQLADFASTGNKQFLIRAAGGVAIGTNDPAGAALRVAGGIKTDMLLGAGSTLMLGIADNQPLELKVNGLRALRFEDNGDGSDSGTIPDGAPNVIGGSPVNFVAAGIVGATIAGGGATNRGTIASSNSVSSEFGFIGGGLGNAVGRDSFGSAIVGGQANSVADNSGISTIAGGSGNAIGANSGLSTVGGGFDNNVGPNSTFVTIAGGRSNHTGANSDSSAIGGGYNITIENDAWSATIAGGSFNRIGIDSDFSAIGGGSNNIIVANSPFATIPGGQDNVATNYAFAAGHRAKAVHTGAFVWADSTDADFTSQADNQFLIRASGGVAIGTNDPAGAALRVAGSIKADMFVGMGSTLTMGTTDNQPLELEVNNVRGLRLEPTATTPNLIGGYSGNSAAAGVVAGVIGGGGNSASPNSIQANFTTIAGGLGNTIERGALYSSIGGGNRNLVRLDSQSATIAGGRENTIHTNSDYAFMGGGYQNNIQSDAPYATLGGGYTNQIFPGASYATISGGWGNTIRSNAQASLIAGGLGNTVSNDSWYATVGGGYSNRIFASANYATIAGGTANTNGLAANYSTVGGGWQNEIRQGAESSVIAGGYRNVISNNASYCVIAGGRENRIAGGAWQATVAGGHLNLAAAFFSFAAGQQARATHYGSFVWSDGSIGAVSSYGDNTFTARTAGGARFYTIADLSVGVNLPAGGGAWAPISDRAVKENVRPVDSRQVLEKVTSLPLNTWNYKSQDDSIRHIGPMAQDFHAAFGVGEDERHITTVDADGVALAAIQGLNQKLEKELRARDAEIGELKRMVSELQQLLQALTAGGREAR